LSDDDLADDLAVDASLESVELLVSDLPSEAGLESVDAFVDESLDDSPLVAGAGDSDDSAPLAFLA
jgi:hypothetical protein